MGNCKLGIYGGTFAPIHNGHVNAARRFYDAMSLDSLLIMPTFLPPHKEAAPGDTPEARLTMARLAFREERRRITVSDYEIRQGGRSYTYLTLRHFASPDTELLFLCGTDMFLSLPVWRRPEEIFSRCTVALIRREAGDPALDERIAAAKERYRREYHAEIKEIPTEPLAISSSEIRQRLLRSQSIRGLVPDPVCEYIAANRLYGVTAVTADQADDAKGEAL